MCHMAPTDETLAALSYQDPTLTILNMTSDCDPPSALPDVTSDGHILIPNIASILLQQSLTFPSVTSVCGRPPRCAAKRMTSLPWPPPLMPTRTGYRAVRNAARDGVHVEAAARACVNRAPSFARLSVRTKPNRITEED